MAHLALLSEALAQPMTRMGRCLDEAYFEALGLRVVGALDRGIPTEELVRVLAIPLPTIVRATQSEEEI